MGDPREFFLVRARGAHDGAPPRKAHGTHDGAPPRKDGYQPRMRPNISGATMVASDSMMNFGVSADSLPQVIFSFGTAPE